MELFYDNGVTTEGFVLMGLFFGAMEVWLLLGDDD